MSVRVGERMEVSKEHQLLGHLKMIYFPFKKKKEVGVESADVMSQSVFWEKEDK